MNIDHFIGSFRSYLVGFLLSLILTLGAFALVIGQFYSPFFTRIFVGLMGFFQIIVILLFYLRLGKESKPRWNLGIFLFMILILCIIIGGSLWIMHHLDYNLMGMD